MISEDRAVIETNPSRASLELKVRLGRTLRLARRYPTTAIGILVIVLMVVMGALAPFLFTGDPYMVDPPSRLQAPSDANWFGTDFLGRDVYARTMYGARISLLVGFTVAAVSYTHLTLQTKA